MTVDRDVRPEDAPGPPAEVSRATILWYSGIAVILLGWFLWGWLVLRQGFVDSMGESLGTGFALLLAISIISTLRHSRR